MVEKLFLWSAARVASIWAPERAQRGIPHRAGVQHAGLIDGRTRARSPV